VKSLSPSIDGSYNIRTYWHSFFNESISSILNFIVCIIILMPVSVTPFHQGRMSTGLGIIYNRLVRGINYFLKICDCIRVPTVLWFQIRGPQRET